MNKYLKVRSVFINVDFNLIGYRKPFKLDYCFITSTSLVPVIGPTEFSIDGLRNETEVANNTASTFVEHPNIVEVHMCKLKVGVAVKLRMHSKQMKVRIVKPFSQPYM